MINPNRSWYDNGEFPHLCESTRGYHLVSSYTFRTGGHGPCCTYYVGMGDFPQLRSSATGYQQKGHLPTTAN